VRLTSKGLCVRWDGKDRWLSDGGGRNCGRLVARITQTGAWFYFLYSHGGKVKRYPLEPFDEEGKRGMTLQAARDRAYELSRVYRSGDTDIHAYARHQVSQAVAAREAVQAAQARERELAQQGSLRGLLDTYVAHLRAQDKDSATDVERMFKNHLPSELLERRAAALQPDDFVAPLRVLTAAEKGKTALDVRGYLHAAYALAEAAPTDPSIPHAFAGFGIDHNTINRVSAKGLGQYKRRRTRALDAHELGACMTRVDAMRTATKDALLVCLYLGGQRPVQLLRLEYARVDLPGRIVILHDKKGRRRQPRPHVLPLVPQTFAIVERHAMNARLAGIRRVWGRMGYRTLSDAINRISKAMVKCGEAREPFQLRDIRRTCETMLRAKPLSIPKDICAHILSHGIGGVQDNVYDTNLYMDEKLEALAAWAAYLDNLRAEHAARQEAMREGLAAL
jgi:integrase